MERMKADLKKSELLRVELQQRRLLRVDYHRSLQ
jgi:hypothetical protein